MLSFRQPRSGSEVIATVHNRPARRNVALLHVCRVFSAGNDLEVASEGNAGIVSHVTEKRPADGPSHLRIGWPPLFERPARTIGHGCRSDAPEAVVPFATHDEAFEQIDLWPIRISRMKKQIPARNKK